MKSQLWLLGVLAPLFAFAQFTEDFSDGNLTANPTWQGETEKFMVNADNQLQLNASDAGTAQLVVPVAVGDSTSWEFWVRLDFAPSASNFTTVYLSADVADLTGSVNGYFVKIGGISGSDDAVELYRQSGTDTALLISGTIGAAGTDPVLTRIRVLRDATGNWELLVDYSGGSDFVQQGTAFDNTHPRGSYFGFLCDFTATRSDLMFFDDIRIAPLFEDTKPPEVTGLTALSATELQLDFSESLNATTATNLANYRLSGNSTIINALLDGSTVTLSVNPELTSGENYTLTVQNLTDEAGNALSDTTLNFEFIETATVVPYDILITEIMTDPTPVLGLPEAEYVELYNRSAKAIDLEGFIFADASDEVLLPNYILLPEERVILYKTDAADFSAFGESLPLDNFPNLNNGSDDLVLLSPDGTTIHAVSYTSDWYQDGDKDDGGWSLEMINTERPCIVGSSNWRASENGNGGTPARLNSVAESLPDVNGAELLRAFPDGQNSLRLFFDEAVDRATAANFDNYTINDLTLRDAFAEPPLFNTVQLIFDAQFEPSVLYQLEIEASFTDCVGNLADSVQAATFAIPELPEVGDIVLNEILFNPESGGSDFVELYNQSDKIFNVGDLILANRDADFRFDQVVPIQQDMLFFPNTYIVLTEDPQYVSQRYKTATPERLVATNVPNLPDDTGTIVVYRPGPVSELILDEFSYTDDFHFALLDDLNGVSLERIDPERATQDGNNWQSASASVGFGTPTVQNSQFFQANTATQTAFFELAKSTFSPDGDGFEDLLLIEYAFDNTGYAATTRIFDAAGRLLHTLTQNELLPQEGVLKWDGLAADGTKARTGIYIVWIEYFSPSGEVRKFQETAVLARRLD